MIKPGSAEQSAICFECGANCCKVMSFFSWDKSYHQRYAWLTSDKIHSEEVEEGLYRISFDYDCAKLVDGKCSVHDGDRPLFCKTYPWGFLQEDQPPKQVAREAESCPLLKKLLEEKND